MKEMKKPRSEDIEISSPPTETKVDGAEKLNALSWLCHHAGQMAKGSAALLGLLALGGLGYYFGRRQSASSSASSVSNALEVVTDFSSALAIDATPTPISFIADAAASKSLNLVYAESAENDDQKIKFGNEEVRQKDEADLKMSSGRNTLQHATTARVERQNTVTAAGTTATEKAEKAEKTEKTEKAEKTKNLVVNGTIPDLLLEVERPWEGSINMTEWFGERITLTGFSQVGNKAFPDWLQASPELTGGVSGFNAHGVTVSDNLAYVAALEGLQIIDISDSDKPFMRSAVSGFDARGVTVRDNLAYVATWNKGLQIVNISDGASPELIKPGITGLTASGVAVSGNLAYVAANQGLKIIDISNSSNPFLISPGVSGFEATGVTIRDNLAYVAANQGLKIIDISNSSNPKLISEVTGFSAWGITVSGNLAYVPAAYYGLKIIDISNSTNPFLIGPGVLGFDARSVTVRGNLAYVAANFGQGLKIIDISNITNPFLVGTGVPGFYAYGVTIIGDLAYIVVWNNSGLKIVDLSQWQLSGSPMQSKSFYQFAVSVENPYSNATKIFNIKTNNFPYVIGNIPSQSLKPCSSLSLQVKITSIFNDRDKEDTLSLAINPHPIWLRLEIEPFFIAKKTNFYSDAYSVTIRDNLAYVATYEGLKIIDISDGANPFLINPGVPGFDARGLTVIGNLAYVATENNQGLKIIDISNSTNPFLIGPGVVGFDARSVAVKGNLAYVAAENDGLKIINISDSANPKLIEPGVSGFSAYGVTVKGNLAYVAAGNNQGLKIIDISNSSSPFLIGPGVPGFDAWGVTVSGNLAYVAAIGGGGLKIIDISNSTNPILTKPSVPGFWANGVRVSGNLAYVAADEGLRVVDISQPNYPTIISEVSGMINDVVVLPATTMCIVGDSFSILNAANYRFSGTPTNSDAGNYNIEIIATDPDGKQAQTSFTIRVEGGPRPVNPISPQIALVGQSTNFFLDQDIFYDPNDDIITYTAQLASGKKLPSFLNFNPSSATFSGVSTWWDKGNYMVTVFASDRIVEPPTPANFTLVVQDPIADQTFIVGRSDSKTLPIPQDSIFEERSLVYNVKPRNDETLPNWLYFDAANRKLFGTPNITDVGIISMQVTLNDDYGEAFFLFNLRVKFNTPPILASMIPVQYAQAGKLYQLVLGKDIFVDADDDPLRYSADSEAVTSWLKFDPESRTFEGTPNGWSSLTRSYTITIIATDPSDAAAAGTFVLNLSSWTQFITAGIVVLGAVATTYGYTHKKHLLWDFFKKDKYIKPRELLVIGDTTFSHQITFPVQRIKSITVTLSQDRSCAKGISPCFKKTLNFFPLLKDAVNDIQTRVFPCTSIYLFPWLFYDSKANTLKSIEGGPTEEFIGKGIKIQIRGTDNRIMEEFQIKVENERNENGNIAYNNHARISVRTENHEREIAIELRQPLIP